MKKENGITLIALVVTIVILVLLVGVTLSVVINTGLIDNSKTATKQWDDETILEQVKMLVLGAYHEDGLNKDEINEGLKKIEELKSIEITSIPAEIEIRGNTYRIEENASVTLVEK